jgi:hypothetical protein
VLTSRYTAEAKVCRDTVASKSDGSVGARRAQKETRSSSFGHYWLTGDPILSGERLACLDFSVAKGGRLTAYRWSGEQNLLARDLVSVPSAVESGLQAK